MRRSIVFALVKKEFYQIVRDPSSILIAFVLPLILLFLFGFGINFDTNTVKIGVIVWDKTPLTTEITDTLQNSRFLDVKFFNTINSAENALKNGTIRGFAVIPVDFSKKYYSSTGSTAEILIVTDGSEPNTAKFVSAYIQGALAVFANIKLHSAPASANNSAPAVLNPASPDNSASSPALSNLSASDNSANTAFQAATPNARPKILLEERFWYNPSLKSTYFILPGSLAIVMTMIGTVLTALVIAREWERGTMEALLTTDVTKGEFLTSKYIAYFLLCMASVVFSILFIIFIFKVPCNGSVLSLLLISAVFVLGAVGFGFIVSTVSKDQFIASQIAGTVGFMPSLMLSGLIYEINSMPPFLRFLTLFIPARYYVSSITSVFLSGTILSTFLINTLLLSLFAILMFIILYKITPMRFE